MTRSERRTVQEMVRRLAEAVRPERIILFGSHARGDAGPDSDVDLLVIASSELPPWRRTPPLYRLLAGAGLPKDLLWYTPEEVAEWQGVRSHFLTRALREGQVVYEKAS